MMTNRLTESESRAFDLLSRMRFACGDNGNRMQDELEEYLRKLKRDAERYRWLRNNGKPAAEGLVMRDPWFWDEAIDAAMAGANDAFSREPERSAGDSAGKHS